MLDRLRRPWCRQLMLLASAQAQMTAGDAPSTRPITLVVPIAAGGGMDTIGRALAERLQERLRQPVVVENRVGAGGVVGVDSVAKAARDGRTLLLMDISAVLHKWLHKSVPFDVITDFAPIAQVATTPLLLFAHPSLPAADVKALIAHARVHKLSVRTPGWARRIISPPPCSTTRLGSTSRTFRIAAPRLPSTTSWADRSR